MDEIEKLICKIKDQYNLNCCDEEVNFCVGIYLAIVTAHRKILKVLEDEHIKIDCEIKKEYILLLYTIAMKYLPEVSKDCRMLICVSLQATYLEELQNTSEIQKYYLEKRKQIEEIEEELESGSAVSYALIYSDEKFFEENIIERIIKGQVEAVVYYLLNEMNKYGLHGWKREEENESDVSGEPELSKSAKEVKRKRTPLEAFRDSAKLCVFRGEVLRRISSLNNRLEAHYDENEKYRESYNIYLIPAGERAQWFVGISIAAAVIGSVLNAVGWVFLVWMLLIAIFAIVRKMDRNQADSRAREIAESTRKLRIEQENHRTKWMEEQGKFVQIRNDITNELYELEKIGGVSESYWEVAGLLWEYVEQKRADSFKEAVNLYHNDVRWKEMEKEYIKLQNKNTRLQQQINELWDNQRELSDEIDRLNTNQLISMLLGEPVYIP